MKCYFCKTFDGMQAVFGKPCCSICKQAIELNRQFYEAQKNIEDSFKKVEHLIKNNES